MAGIWRTGNSFFYIFNVMIGLFVFRSSNGDGELKWANGDKYVGKFKDGFIEGRGTISFHDGKLFV